MRVAQGIPWPDFICFCKRNKPICGPPAVGQRRSSPPTGAFSGTDGISPNACWATLAPQKRTCTLTSEQVRNDIHLIATLYPAKDKRIARSRAILTFSALVGAMSLARAVSDEALSREILNTVAELLRDSA